ncbi:uncharacterized protein SPAPADRAFT_69369 [Spathaspora passalidarum NRRL Y-27907]|uniref:RRM domain-containing protein n=1 Tax=Spathaspora passalidarum (strain NRRL Y-27907 / 11-Y1) TaxID=619300 RepID=G3AFN2_SPAPN|nr:uncharacterized protein SPAPADRAFT_69369 [Spathaspora passalidarum NRRL Y-27907]EGW35020.1 hypothetical protein SPAPADRAFT_69369 [Spathaspora passalidarum NRRL Y-27907]
MVVWGRAYNDGLDRKTLFVRSIPFDATSEELSEFFSQFVPVKHAVIVNDNEQKSRGFGFVSFTMDDDTLTALVESRKAKFKGRLLRVDIAKRRDRKDKSGEEPIKREPQAPVEKRRARLIVRNLPWSCKKPDTLKKLFSKYGAVFDAYIPKKKGGQMCGFAFVTMKKQAAAERAVKESVGLKIDGREVAVDLAVEKSKWEQIKEDEPEEESEEEQDEQEEEIEEKEDDEEGEEGDEEDDDDEDKNEDFHNLNEINSDDEPESDIEIEQEADEEEEEKPRKKSNRQEPFAIFIRNIPYDADEESLAEHFNTHFGPVKYALPVIDKQTGLAKGSAFAAFVNQDSYTECIENAPTVASTSMLIPDDVSAGYVYQGRILSITSAVDRTSANRLAERNSEKRKEALGKAPSEKDKRNLFLLNEGRITTNSKLAQFISKTDLELREKSYKLRVQQLNKNPTLHLSLTRLAIRNLPRAMNSKALKALGRKAVVSFATEVKEEKRQPLSKEEVNRSIKFKHDLEGDDQEQEEKKKKNKHMGVVRQAKVIMEVKGTGEVGRSRGYGFIEFRDHKAALMGLRWLNAHEVSISEIVEGLTDEEKKVAKLEGLAKRRLIAEFAIENAQVVKRRREKVMIARKHGTEGDNKDYKDKKRRRGDDDNEKSDKPGNKKRKGPSRKGNMNKGPKSAAVEQSEPKNKSGLSDDVKKIIGMKRMRRKGKK